MTLVTRPDTSTTSTLYNGLTSAVTVHIVGGTVASEKTTTRKNARGLVASVTNALNKTATYAYDAVGDLVTATDSAGQRHDLFLRRAGQQDRLVRSGHGALDLSVRRVRVALQPDRRKGQVAVVSYDPLGRATRRTEAGPGQPVDPTATIRRWTMSAS